MFGIRRHRRAPLPGGARRGHEPTPKRCSPSSIGCP